LFNLLFGGSSGQQHDPENWTLDIAIDKSPTQEKSMDINIKVHRLLDEMRRFR
jgi:hypothetical protein